MAADHALHADGQRDGDDRGQALGYRRDRETDGDHELVEKFLALDNPQREDERADAERDPDKQPPHTFESLLQRGALDAEFLQQARDLADLGLHPKAFFMVGHPTETEETIQDSIDFARSLPLTDITVQINTPLPGAPQFEIFRSYGESVSDNLEDYTFWQPVFIPQGLSREKLEKLFRKFYLSFYLRPIIVWRHLTMLRRPSDIPRYARALALLFQRFIKTRVDAVFHTSQQA